MALTLSPSQIESAYQDSMDRLVAQARNSILGFTRFTKPDYQIGWHHAVVAKYLDLFEKKKITRLIISMPPRHGKSELVSRRLPAYIFGRNPKAKIIAVSYGDALASMMNRDVQRVMDSDLCRQVFPESALWGENVRSVAHGTYLRNSDIFEIVGHGGVYRSAGVGGGITGMGADFCFPKGVAVRTHTGYTDISEIREGDYVWSVNHTNGQTELKRVEAVCSRFVTDLVQVKTAQGREVISTPEHPFWSKEHGYRQAQALSGDGLIVCGISPSAHSDRRSGMHFLWKALRSAAIRLREVTQAWPHRRLLLKYLLSAAPQREEPPQMQDLLTAGSQSWPNILQPELRAYTQARPLWLSALSNFFWKDQGSHSASRRFSMRRLCFSSRLGDSSHKRSEAGQPHRESDHSVQSVPHVAPSLERDQVSSVERISRSQIRVYDIQVAGNHNFFANGILVHNCIIDDPIKNQEEADSQVYRDRVWDWYGSTLYTRLEREGSILLTMTRWHEDDLAGRLIDLAKADPDADQWTVVSLPAVMDSEPTQDDKRAVGEALWPWKYPVEKLRRVKASSGARVWNALYQQAPSPSEGSIIKRDWWQWYTALPEGMDKVIQSWDLTFTEGESTAFVVGQVWGRKGARKYLIDQFRARVGFNGQLAAIRAMSAKHPTATAKYIENAANAHAVLEVLKKEISGLILFPAKGSKVVRAEAVAPQAEAQNVFLPDPSIAPWIGDFVEEWAGFPYGKNADQVDASSHALRILEQGATFDFMPFSLTQESKWK